MHMSARVCTAAALLAFQFATAPAQAQTGPDAGRRLYASCAACHGTDGRPAAGGSLPALAGQSRESLVASMKGFQDGSRPATIMHQIARGYTSEQIELIAAYLAAPGNRERP